jgi:uncharacterized protein YraI
MVTTSDDPVRVETHFPAQSTRSPRLLNCGRRRLTGSVVTGGTVLVTSALLLVLVASPALANPATAARYQPGASATSYAGQAFDTCTAPPLTAIAAWSASPYRAVGVYIGGLDRTCSQPELTASWVASVSGLGWRLLPVYKGMQAPCGSSAHKITSARAGSQGSTAADDAVRQATSLGMLSGSAIYYDMENYPLGQAACRAAVLAFLSSWTTEVHRLGYVSGVYAQLYSGAADLTGVFGSATVARPDALWIARYDGATALSGWAGIPDSYWSQQQRAKQYQGGHDESYGGVTLNIDSDQVSAPVATVARPYRVTSTTPLSARRGPGTSYHVTRTYAPGAALRVTCQASGQRVGSTKVWDKLATGRYVPDYYVSTRSDTGYSPPLQHCTYPYQVTAAGGVTKRRGPSRSYRRAGQLPAGALARVTCQRAGARVGSTAVWDRLAGGQWVTDYYLSSPSKRSYSPPVPRC